MSHTSVRANPLSLADIMQNEINLSVWSREPTAELQREAENERRLLMTLDFA